MHSFGRMEDDVTYARDSRGSGISFLVEISMNSTDTRGGGGVCLHKVLELYFGRAVSVQRARVKNLAME